MATRLAGRVALLSRNFTNNSGAGRRFITSKTSGFSSKSTTVPFLFGATLGVGSVLAGLHIANKFNHIGNITGVLTQTVHAARKVN